MRRCGLGSPKYFHGLAKSEVCQLQSRNGRGIWGAPRSTLRNRAELLSGARGARQGHDPGEEVRAREHQVLHARLAHEVAAHLSQAVFRSVTGFSDAV